MSPVPRALTRARLWTSGLLTASTLFVGGLGVHLAQDHAASVATPSSATTTDDSSSSTDASSSDTPSSGSSGTSGSSNSSGTSNQSSGFQAVVPLSGSGGHAQSGSGGS